MIIGKEMRKSSLFKLVQREQWENVTSYLIDSTEGRLEAQLLGIDLLYVAVSYRAPPNVIMLIFNIVENDKGRQMKLNSKMLLKALYISPKSETKFCTNESKRRWEKTERSDVACFLSRKIRNRTSPAA